MFMKRTIAHESSCPLMKCLSPQKMLVDSSYNPYFPPVLCQFNMPTFLGCTLVTMLGSGSPIPEAEWGESWDSMDIPPLRYQQSLNHWKLLEANGQNQFQERTLCYLVFPFVFTPAHQLHQHHSTSSSSFLGPRLPLPRLVSPFPTTQFFPYSSLGSLTCLLAILDFHAYPVPRLPEDTPNLTMGQPS